MKTRRLLLACPLVVALTFTGLSPARAALSDPAAQVGVLPTRQLVTEDADRQPTDPATSAATASVFPELPGASELVASTSLAGGQAPGLGPGPQDPADTPAPVNAPNVHIGRGDIPVGESGQPMEITIPLKNWGGGDAYNVRVTPQVAVDAANFPFEITSTDYTAVLDSLAAGAEGSVGVSGLRLRAGLVSGYYRLPVTIEYSDGQANRMLSTAIFIQVNGVAVPQPEAPPPVTTQPPQTVEVVVTQAPAADSGAGMGAGMGTGGYQPAAVPVSDPNTSGTTQGSQPRVMLTNFATNPPEVQAGTEFGLAFALQNMSTRTGVANLKVTVVAPDAAFLPVGGASSVYIESIGANQTATRQLEFRALPTLEERPYQLTLRIEYEDASNQQALTAEETIAVVVRQRARAETGAIQVLPSTLSVGQDANISFTVQNQGKVRLYNARVRVKQGMPVTANELFVGNVEPGASANVDLMVHAEKANDKPVILEISYEDAAGVATTMEREVTLEVLSADDEQSATPQPTPAQEGGGGVFLPIMLISLLVIAAIVAIYLIRERRKRRQEEEMASSLRHLDAEPIVPVDPR